MGRGYLAMTPMKARLKDLAAVIQLTCLPVTWATTFITTIGSKNWLTCGAHAKITARPSSRHVTW
eukprot:251676-Rhodomonas_salina.2